MSVPNTTTTPQPLGELLRETIADFRRAAQHFSALFGSRARESVQAAKLGAGLLGGAICLGIAGLVFVGFAAVHGLLYAAPALGPGWANAIVGVFVVAGAGLCVVLARQKFSAIEAFQADTAEAMKEANMIAQDVGNAVESISQTVEQKIESAKEAFDLPHQVEQHPWTMVAGAIVVGLVAGVMLPGSSRREDTEYNAHAPAYRPTPMRKPESDGWLHQIGDALTPELDMVKGMAIGALLGVAREVAINTLPRVAGPQLDDLLGLVGKRFGVSVPLGGSTPDSKPQSNQQQTSSAHGTESGTRNFEPQNGAPKPMASTAANI